jgi:hypothetical protein
MRPSKESLIVGGSFDMADVNFNLSSTKPAVRKQAALFVTHSKMSPTNQFFQSRFSTGYQGSSFYKNTNPTHSIITTDFPSIYK